MVWEGMCVIAGSISYVSLWVADSQAESKWNHGIHQLLARRLQVMLRGKRELDTWGDVEDDGRVSFEVLIDLAFDAETVIEFPFEAEHEFSLVDHGIMRDIQSNFSLIIDLIPHRGNDMLNIVSALLILGKNGNTEVLQVIEEGGLVENEIAFSQIVGETKAKTAFCLLLGMDSTLFGLYGSLMRPQEHGFQLEEVSFVLCNGTRIIVVFALVCDADFLWSVNLEP